TVITNRKHTRAQGPLLNAAKKVERCGPSRHSTTARPPAPNRRRPAGGTREKRRFDLPRLLFYRLAFPPGRSIPLRTPLLRKGKTTQRWGRKAVGLVKPFPGFG